jgi:hypothetical protein
VLAVVAWIRETPHPRQLITTRVPQGALALTGSSFVMKFAKSADKYIEAQCHSADELNEGESDDLQAV